MNIPLHVEKIVWKYIFDTILNELKDITEDIATHEWDKLPRGVPQDDFHKYFIDRCIRCEYRWTVAYERLDYDYTTREVLIEVNGWECEKCWYV